MNDTVIRRATADELPALQILWETVFGDPPEFIHAFFAHFPPEASGWVVSRGAEICSAAYLLTGNSLVRGGCIRPCAYVYAVATPAAMRGNGYASRLMRHFAHLADEEGFALYTRPAEPELFAWYREVMGASGVGTESDTVVLRDSCSEPSLPVRAESPAAYAKLREAQLAGVPHVALSEAFLALQAECSTLLRVGDGCAAAEIDGDKLLVKELLVPESQRKAAAQALLQWFCLDTAIVRQQTLSQMVQPLVAFRPFQAMPHSPINWGLLLD